MNSTIDSKTSKMACVFYPGFFENGHTDFLLQSVFWSSTATWLITFLVDEYHRIFF